MSFDTKALRESLGEIRSQQESLARTIEQEARVFSNEELGQYDALEAQAVETEQKIATAERLEKSRQYSKPTNSFPAPYVAREKKITAKDQSLAFAGWALYHSAGRGQVADSMRFAADRLGIDISSKQYNLRLYSTPTEALDVDAAAFPDNAIRGVLEVIKSMSPVRQFADVIVTDNANSLPWMVEDDTENMAAARAKLEAPSNTDYELGKFTLGSYGYSAKVGPIAYETLRDAAVDLRSRILTAIAKRMARKSNLWHTTGTGTAEPKGICNAVTPTLLYPATGEVDWYDVLTALKNGVDGYHADPNDPEIGFHFGTDILQYLENTRNASGDPMWVKSMTEGNPGRLRGYRYYVNPSMTSGLIQFGRLHDFVIRDVSTVRLVVDEATYIENNAVSFLAFGETDSGYAATNSIVAARAVVGSEAANCGVIADEE